MSVAFPSAGMAELADAADSKSAGTWYLGGSTPPPGTTIYSSRGKAAEIVDRSRSSAHGDGRIFNVPVRRHREYRLRPRQNRADGCPLLCITVCQQCIHGIPVPNG